jgi:hypothetical protein
MLSPEKQEQIALIVIKILRSRFESFPIDAASNRNAPFHEAFLQAFADELAPVFADNLPYFITLGSWLHGLTTTLGQTFFEGVAHILSDGRKEKFSGASLRITRKQAETISQITTALKNRNQLPNLDRENALLLDAEEGETIEGQDFVADNFVETANYVEAIELKTVRPNSGIALGEKEKILRAKAALKRAYPDKEVRYFMGFPFDPFSATPTGYDKPRFMHKLIEFEKYFDPREILVANELWDRLSSEPNTMEQILAIINTIATTEFMDNYVFLADGKNATLNQQRYLSLLVRWSLFHEKALAERIAQVLRLIESNRNLQRLYYQPVFSATGEYNERRRLKLWEAVNNFNPLL